MQETVVISNPWHGDANDVTVFGCNPQSEQACLRDRAAVAVYGGAFSLLLRATRPELLAWAELLRQAAETIPEGS